ncbi:MAG: hypothetical protein U5K38_03080 [Woeseiaceae bacterium]|nr:hypothetical protein [Woeseiaceae bacterium]
MRPGQTLGFAGWKEQFLLQWDHPAVHFGYRRKSPSGESRDAARWVSGDDDHRLVLRGDMVEPCFDPERLKALGLAHRDYWFLAAGTAVLPACRAASGAAVSVIVYDPSGPR